LHRVYLSFYGEVEKHRSAATVFFGWGAALSGSTVPHPKNRFAALRNFVDLPTKGEVI
jgi:hypothetical protein